MSETKCAQRGWPESDVMHDVPLAHNAHPFVPPTGPREPEPTPPDAVRMLLDALAESPGVKLVFHSPDCDSVLSTSDVAAGIAGKPCNCGADRVAQIRADAALGAALRKALDEVAALHVSEDDPDWHIIVFPHDAWLTDSVCAADSEATAALAALLHSPKGRE